METQKIHVFSFSLFFMGRGRFHSLPCFFATRKANPRTLSDMARFYNFPKEEAPRARGGKTSELGGWEARGFCMFLLLFLKGEEVIWKCFSSTYLVVSLYSKVGGCTSWSRNWNTESDQSFFYSWDSERTSSPFFGGGRPAGTALVEPNMFFSEICREWFKSYCVLHEQNCDRIF